MSYSESRATRSGLRIAHRPVSEPPGAGQAGGCRLEELTAAQAGRTPEAVAVVSGGERLSYAELERRSNRLARYLQSCGVGPEQPVGILLERSLELVVTLLGVLKAGGAYLPLDPTYPQRRLSLVLEDARAAKVVTRRRYRELLAGSSTEPIELETVAPRLAGERGSPPAHRGVGDNLAYVIYTSGSTGRPKGVAITHRSAVALVSWARRVFGSRELTGTLAATSICFDLSVFEIFAPLAVGGRVVLARDALELPRLLEREEVRLLNTVPSAARELVRLGGWPKSLRTVNLAGEPLRRSLAEELYALETVERVWNLYGPTEDTTYSTASLVPRGEAGAPSIGRPIDGTRVELADARLEPVPAGETGELLLAGSGLARGYLDKPGLTAQRWVPDPFAGEPGGRLYRTGDLARRRLDGSLDFLGRSDHQVKIRGHRIELGEIEVALLAHPAVEECSVLAREPSPASRGGDRCLVAYVVPGTAPPTGTQLRRELGEKLPAYMVPGHFVLLEELPRSPNGKIDRAALARRDLPSGGVGEPAPGFVAPRSRQEAIVAGVWAEVLDRRRVGVRDPFLELGGHSLLATRIVARLRRQLGVELPPGAVLEAGTVEKLALDLDVLRRDGVGRGVDAERHGALRRVPRDRGLPLSFAQQGLFFLAQLEPASTSYNVPVCLRLEGALRPALLRRCLRQLAERHGALRTTFRTVGGQPVQWLRPTPELALPLACLARLEPRKRGAELERLALEALGRPFDLAVGPLLDARLVRLGEEEHRLLLTVPHVAFDEWSVSVLVEDLAILYEAAAGGEPPALAPLAVRYADFAVWQRRRLRGEVLDALLAYWKHQLQGAPPLLELAPDHPRAERGGSRGSRLGLAVDAALTRALRELGSRHGATLFMTSLAAFLVLLGRRTGATDLVVGTAVAGRDRVETERLIGNFVNTLVLRVGLLGNPTLGQLIERVRRVTLDAFAHQELPFEKLVEELRPPRRLGRTPLFQVAFGVRNAPPPRPPQAALRWSVADTPPVEARFDLTVWIEEEGDGLRVDWTYRSDLFRRSTIAGLHGEYVALLRRFVERPESDLRSLAVGGSAQPASRRRDERHRKLLRARPKPLTAAPGNEVLRAAPGKKPAREAKRIVRPEI